MAKRKTRRRFSDEFKSEAVKLVKQSNRSMADLAMELGINAKSIGEWVKRAEENGQSIDEDERAELRCWAEKSHTMNIYITEHLA